LLELGDHNITITGTSQLTGIEHEISFNLHILPAQPGFDLMLNGSAEFQVYEHEPLGIEFSIIPRAQFVGEINITITGLSNTMKWNNEISPITIEPSVTKETVLVTLTDLNQSGDYDITIEASSANQTKQLNLSIKVLPELKDDSTDEPDNNILEIILLVAILIIILIFVSKLTKRSSPDIPKRKTKSDSGKAIKDDEDKKIEE
jgi:uncharacterized membrane protein